MYSTSNCCDATMTEDICNACKEHAEEIQAREWDEKPEDHLTEEERDMKDDEE